MYIHLQKKKMKKLVKNTLLGFAIARNTFYDLDVTESTEYTEPEKYIENVEKFKVERKCARRKQVVTNLMNGALRARVYRKLRKWKSR